MNCIQFLPIFHLIIFTLTFSFSFLPPIVNCDEYFLYTGLCLIPEIFSASNILVGEATRSVCQILCSDIYDTQCSSFLFNRIDRTCIISAYTGEWLPRSTTSNPAAAAATSNCSSGANKIEFYRRKRCLSEKMRCSRLHFQQLFYNVKQLTSLSVCQK